MYLCFISRTVEHWAMCGTVLYIVETRLLGICRDSALHLIGSCILSLLTHIQRIFSSANIAFHVGVVYVDRSEFCRTQSHTHAHHTQTHSTAQRHTILFSYRWQQKWQWRESHSIPICIECIQMHIQKSDIFPAPSSHVTFAPMY